MRITELVNNIDYLKQVPHVSERVTGIFSTVGGTMA
jgi:hypothetical protein